MYNLNAMDRFSLLVVLAVLSCLAGCVPIPVGFEHPAELADNQTLDSLIGENKTTILTSLGRPDIALIGEKPSYFIYGGLGDEYQIWLMGWFPIYGEKHPQSKLFCILLEFDAGNIFRRYRIERRSELWSGKKRISQCASTFFSKEELESFTTKDAEVDAYVKKQLLKRKKQLLKRARQEGRDAQWEIYQEFPTEEHLIWLCRAADKGHTSARNELGELYLYGSEQYRKFKNIHIAPDLPRSCMWFYLAGEAQIADRPGEKELVFRLGPYESAELDRTANTMTAVELAEAEELILAWEPGQCERDLYFYLGMDYVGDSDLARLCMAADQGDFSARDELGREYFFGLSGRQSDLPRAYMWYHLAAQVYVPLSMRVGSKQSLCDSMTPEQRSIAVKYLEAWRSGICEQDLSINRD